MSKDDNIVVIGAGAVGLCTAYQLWKEGYHVTVLDKNGIGNEASCSNAGLIVPSHVIPLASPGNIAQGMRWLFRSDSPFYIRPRFSRDLLNWILKFRKAGNQQQMEAAMPILGALLQESLSILDSLSRLEGVDFKWKHEGLLMLYRSEYGKKNNQYQAQQVERTGQEVNHLSAEELHSSYPGLNKEVMGAFYYPRDGQLRPDLLVRDIANYLKTRGVEFEPGTEVTELIVERGKTKAVKTNKGVKEADAFVLTAGAWTSQLTDKLNIRLPLQPAKGYSITINKSRDISIPSIPLMLTEKKVTVTPYENSLRFAGTLELSGFDKSIDYKRLEGITNAVPRYLSDITADEIRNENYGQAEIWAGHRPCSPDGLPYLGRLDHADNLIIATGHCMTGVALAPITGKLVAELLNEQTPSVDLSLLDVNRYN